MSNNFPNITRDDITDALGKAIDKNWLKVIDHGYCFHCLTEGQVYEIIDPFAPIQPPRCGECFTSAALALASDPEVMGEIISEAYPKASQWSMWGPDEPS
jgi:hypothetical protein